MGEARLRRKLLDTLKAKQVFCIYCGGLTPGATVDHMPPKTIFALKHRPKGLEFLACEACNSGSRPDEQVASMISRLYPDPETRAEQEEVEGIFKAVANNHAGLLRELWPSRRAERRFDAERSSLGEIGEVAGGALVASGPLLTAAMERFGAKLGLALHREETGRTVPLSGGVAVRWYSNYDRARDRLPDELLSFLGGERSLRQGRFSVENQFTYASAVAVDRPTFSVHFATFRLSFAILAFVEEDVSQLEAPRAASVFRPGFLKQLGRPQTVFRTDMLRWTQ